MKDLYDPKPSVEPCLGLTTCPNILIKSPSTFKFNSRVFCVKAMGKEMNCIHQRKRN